MTTRCRLLSVPQQDVVEEEDADRHEETGRAAAPPVSETERDSVEAEHQTGRRDGELLVDLDQRPVPLRRGPSGLHGPVEELGESHGTDVLRQYQPLFVPEEAVLECDVGVPESLELVRARVVRVDLVDVGDAEPQDRLAGGLVQIDPAGLAHDHLLFRARHGVGEEDPSPAFVVLGGLEDVEDTILKLVVEHLRLDLLTDVSGQNRQAKVADRLVARG